MSFASDIEMAAGGEDIVAIVIGQFGWGGDPAYGENRIDRPVEKRVGEVLSWADARPMLDYGYSDGYGAPECDAITAWTENRVLFVVQYDGSTRVDWMPRNPVAHDPDMPGG